MSDLIDELRSRATPPGSELRGQAEALAARLGAVTEPEAQELYRAAAEGRELPEMAEPTAYLVEPLVLFGPDYVIKVIEGIRTGIPQPTAQRELHVELLPEFWDDQEWDYRDPDWNYRSEN